MPNVELLLPRLDFCLARRLSVDLAYDAVLDVKRDVVDFRLAPMEGRVDDADVAAPPDVVGIVSAAPPLTAPG